MNDIAKQAISERLVKAISQEKITQQKASQLLGLKSKYYAGFICSGKENQWKNVSKAAWEQVRDWANSGETIYNYNLKVVQDLYVRSNIERDAEVVDQKPDVTDEHDKEYVKFIKETLAMVRKGEKHAILKHPHLGNVRVEIDLIFKINGKEVVL